MKGIWKRIAISLMALFLVLVASATFIISRFGLTHHIEPKILKFHPANFPAKANAKFFYSISNNLKYSEQITSDAPTLLHGRISSFVVSPDRQKIACVVNGDLMVVDALKRTATKVVAVSSIYKKPKPLGESFFRDQDYGWSRNSEHLYVIRDKYYPSTGSQLLSDKGELWAYEISSKKLQSIISPFPAYEYFFSKSLGIFFAALAPAGEFQLKYFDGRRTVNVGQPGDRSIPNERLKPFGGGMPFYSFPESDYQEILATQKGIKFETKYGALQELSIGGNVILTFRPGEGPKGPIFGIDTNENALLPGERYLVITVRSEEFSGQVLVDTKSGGYMLLPQDTRVFETANTDTFHDYVITAAGIKIRHRDN